MVEDIKLDRFLKKAGVYLLKVNEEVIYVGSSNNLHTRMVNHRSLIRKGSNAERNPALYDFLKSNQFTIEYQLTINYKQLEQQLIEQYHPKFNAIRAYTGLGAFKGRVAEYEKERYHKYKEEILGKHKQYSNQLCLYNGETITLDALRKRFSKAGITHPVIEAKKYLIGDNDD